MSSSLSIPRPMPSPGPNRMSPRISSMCDATCQASTLSTPLPVAGIVAQRGPLNPKWWQKLLMFEGLITANSVREIPPL